MKTRRRKHDEDETTTIQTKTAKKTEAEGDAAVSSSSRYEEIRQQRMKENAERMHKLGLLNLSLSLKKTTPRPYVKKNALRLTQSEQPERRSSRIMTLAPINYRIMGMGPKAEPKKKREVFKSPKAEPKKKREVEIHIPEGTNPEVYNEEHEKLLGDCEAVWELYVDGYDEDGTRIYDPIKGEICHQCRLITVGQLTDCNKYELPQGQICGDCLYTRYGENLYEVDVNPKWTCPSCRDICNCNSCRRKKGWMATGNIYNKVVKLGFKSVAHYLIKSRRSEKSMESSVAEIIVAQEIPENSPNLTPNRPIRTRRSLRS